MVDTIESTLDKILKTISTDDFKRERSQARISNYRNALKMIVFLLLLFQSKSCITKKKNSLKDKFTRSKADLKKMANSK